MMKRFILIMLMFCTLPSLSYGQGITGNKLLESCRASIKSIDGGHLGTYSEWLENGLCFGYIGGMTDGFTFVHAATEVPPFGICVPDNVPPIQKIRIIVRYLQNRPGDLHNNGAYLAILALKDSFPCKTANN